ncbi:trigger factor [Candidatus Omnitrophus magneticus]|uniref:Trigger factor n=1 Tax=Candidatus Omnitrophus magneticus TaxID=1609969 RepID=A0A0F0CS76_9BACT|nr:trigger factor [Candidatus Omnitrophus magneticus]
MKSSVKKIEGTAREINVTVPHDRVKDMVDKVVLDIRKEAVMPGFRKGNAPIDMIHTRFKDTIIDEVKKRLVPDVYEDVLSEHKLDPVSYPEISNLSLDVCTEKGMSFTVKVDIHPEVKLKNYKGIHVESKKIDVKDEEIDKVMERLREASAEFFNVDRPVQKGDVAVCFLEGFVGAKLVTKRETMWIIAEKESSLLGIGEEIVGLKQGEEKEITVTLPDDYTDKTYAGKAVNFKVKVKEVKEKKLPELNDDLAKKHSKETLIELRNGIKDHILEDKERANKSAMKDQIINDLLKKHSFDLPESMVKRQGSFIAKKIEEDLEAKGVSKEAIEENKEKSKKEILEVARKKVMKYFILFEIAEQEDIAVVAEDVESELIKLSATYGKDYETVRKYYEEKNLLGGLEEQIREDKTLDFLLAQAKIDVK